MDQDTTHNHFTKIATDIIQDLSAKGILELKKNETSDEDLDLHSNDGQAIIKAIAVNIYDGTIKDMNTNRAPELMEPDNTPEAQRQKQWRDANYHHPVPGPGRRG